MTQLWRTMSPIPTPKPKVDEEDDDDDMYNVEYSFAIEYTGPPLSYVIPQAAPVDVSHIPTAFPASSVSSDLSLPIIQPLAKAKKVLPSPPIITTVPNPSLVPHNDDQSSSGSLGFLDSRGVDEVEASPSHDSTCNEEDTNDDDEAPPQTVTFREPESGTSTIHSVISMEDEYEQDVARERREVSSRVKKGLCHRCLKGNRFVSKVVCLVCDAKYCAKCVIRAMGSMPEGRKCIPCIGLPIDESKRSELGKCPLVLRRLLSHDEVKEKMESEVSSEANRLPSWLVIVNDQPLSPEELVLLQSCPNPPKRLRPGRYWYDKKAGFWGKEGHKPSQIITHELTVGGQIMINASNGNTKVLINKREITKAELLMLQFVRINCEGCPHFWVAHDGTFQEEGQNQERGKIWQKKGIKTICALLALPMPPQSVISPEGDNGNTIKEVSKNYDEMNSLTKLLLVGKSQSGTSTLFKQAKILYHVPFSEDERQNVKMLIQRNLYYYLAILLDGRKQFEEELATQLRRKLLEQPSTSTAHIDEKNIYSISPGLKSFSEWLLQVTVSGNLEAVFPAATREYAPIVEDLWRDKAFQATYDRRNELGMLPRVADYFLPRAVEISRLNYEPSDMDILYADGITSSNGLTSMEFSFPRSPKTNDSFTNSNAADPNQPLPRFQLVRVNSSSIGENCKWLEMFEDVDLVLFAVDLTSYDEYYEFYETADGVPRNKMLESKKLFETMISHPSFKGKDFLLILTKFDLLEDKIETVPLKRCEWFHDFNPVISQHNRKSNAYSKGYNATLGQSAFQYIANKFKRVFENMAGRKLYVTSAMGLEADSVDATLKYGREILKWIEEEKKKNEENKPNGSTTEWSTESAEASEE